MSRLKQLRAYVDARLDALDQKTRRSAYVHLYGVSLAATLIARSVDRTLSLPLWQQCFTIWQLMRRAAIADMPTGAH